MLEAGWFGACVLACAAALAQASRHKQKIQDGWRSNGSKVGVVQGWRRPEKSLATPIIGMNPFLLAVSVWRPIS
jgi:hypothetical protein